MLPRQDECCPRFYLGKDEVECGNTASMTRGGPAVRTRQMGQYFQAVLYTGVSVNTCLSVSYKNYNIASLGLNLKTLGFILALGISFVNYI